MKIIRSIAAVMALGLAASVAAPALAADTMGGMKMSGSLMAGRFGGGVYAGKPALPLTLSMIIAGGGPKAFKTPTLVGVLAGDKATAEVASLTKKYGKANVAQFLKTFDFVVNDSLAIVTKAKIALPNMPSPDPTDGKALAGALYKGGVDSKGKFTVEYMLDHLVSHPVHVQVMKDIDAKYGVKADATYHVAFTQVMLDLKSVYGL